MARTTVTVGDAAGSGNAAMPGMPGMAAHGTKQMSDIHGNAEMMVLQHSTSGGEWAVIAAVILSAGGGGIALLRKAAATGYN